MDRKIDISGADRSVRCLTRQVPSSLWASAVAANVVRANTSVG